MFWRILSRLLFIKKFLLSSISMVKLLFVISCPSVVTNWLYTWPYLVISYKKYIFWIEKSWRKKIDTKIEVVKKNHVSRFCQESKHILSFERHYNGRKTGENTTTDKGTLLVSVTVSSDSQSYCYCTSSILVNRWPRRTHAETTTDLAWTKTCFPPAPRGYE